jgi:LacI family transcriptional regulator
VARERLDGIRAELSTDDRTLEGQIECNWWPESAYEAMGRHLDAGGPRPRALICMNDRVAMGCYQAAKERGISIPDEMTIVSFDDSPLATWMQPQLTSVAIPYRDMGALAVRMVLEPPPTAETIRLPMALMVRESSKTPR